MTARARIRFMSRHVRVYGALALGVLLMGSLVVLARAPRGSTEEKLTSDRAADASRFQAPPPAARVFRADAIESAPTPAAQAAIARLRRDLSSPHIAERVDAIRQAARTGDRQVLDLLRKVPLSEDPATTPTRILAIGTLAQLLDGDGQDAAIHSLSRWLVQAVGDGESDTAGHVALIVETLGRIGGDDAVEALVDVLQNPSMPLHVQTLAVQGLGRIGAAGARAALDAFRRDLSARSTRTEFEAVMVKEAQRASDQAVAKLSRGAAPWQPWAVP